jgi:hypothetical protein
MARDFNGSNQYLSTASAPATAMPLTMACWHRPAQTAIAKAIISISTTGAGANGRFQISQLVSPAGTTASSITDAGAAVDAVATKTLVANTWYHSAAVFTSSTNRSAFIDGAETNSATSNAGPTNPNSVLVGSRVFGGNFGAYFDGDIAEVGIWNTALTAAEIAALAKGMTCDKVRPQSLVFYAPLVRDLQDVRGGVTITNNNTATVATHPRVYA